MATKRKKKEYVTIKIGEYDATRKGGEKYKKKIFSRIDKTVATSLGLNGSPSGERLIRKIRKGAAAGAQYAVLALGVRGKGYSLGFLKPGNSSDTKTKERSVNYKLTKIPMPSGVPLAVVAKFAAKLKTKPQKIVTPRGTTYYLNNSKNSQGK